MGLRETVKKRIQTFSLRMTSTILTAALDLHKQYQEDDWIILREPVSYIDEGVLWMNK